MVKKTLIAYATKSNATGEAATIIQEVLQEKYAHKVELANLGKTPNPDFEEYDSIIIGSGIRMGRWYKSALRFIQNNFGERKVAVFVSSAEAGDIKTYDAARKNYIENILAKIPHINPIASEAFGGRVQVFKKTIEDYRDPEKVRKWTEELGKKL